MSAQKKLYSKLPSIIKSTLIISDGWLVGSSIRDLINDESVVDYDIIVPVDNWWYTMVHLKNYPHSINTFGGTKFTVDNVVLDIWPEDTDHFLKVAVEISYMFNLKHQPICKS